MRHYEDYEIENMIQGTGNVLFRLCCKHHLKKCSVCRGKFRMILRNNHFIEKMKCGLSELESMRRETIPPAESEICK